MELEFVNNENFEEVVNNNSVVLIDFFATWCGPCKMLSPVLEQVNEEIGSEVKIAKLDIDSSLELAKKFNVMSVPTMILFKDGKEADRLVGLMPKDKIITAIKSL